MNNLLEFFRKYYYWFVFLLLEGISLFMLIRFNNYQGSVYFTAANSAAAHINSTFSNIAAYHNLGDVNEQLTSENIRLQQEVNSLRERLVDAEQNHTIADSIMRTQLAEYTVIPAKVVSNSIAKKNNYIVIDKGEKDGIQKEMGVVSGNGIVGLVYLTARNHSLVLPLINQKLNISCRIRGESHFGSTSWDGKDHRTVYVDDIARYAKLKKGVIIETSGFSAFFPPGLTVGKLNSATNSPDGQSYRLKVDLGTDFSTLRDVCVITTPYKAEIDTLQHKAAIEDENQMK